MGHSMCGICNCEPCECNEEEYIAPRSVLDEHKRLVSLTCKPGCDITISDEQAHLVHMLMGITGEAGELMDAIKKHTIYNKPLDTLNVIEELGDIEWYMEGLRVSLDVTREQVLRHNINKLNARYPNLQYTDSAAQERADKKE